MDVAHQISAACQLPGAENEWNVPSQEGVGGVGGVEAWVWAELVSAQLKPNQAPSYVWQCQPPPLISTGI